MEARKVLNFGNFDAHDEYERLYSDQADMWVSESQVKDEVTAMLEKALKVIDNHENLRVTIEVIDSGAD